MMNKLPRTLLLLSTTVAIAPQGAVALSSSSSSTTLHQKQNAPSTTIKDRPLLRKFGNSISERVINSKEGYNRFGLDDHYTSAETIPCLDLQTTSSGVYDGDMSSRREIRRAYTANDNTQQQHGDEATTTVTTQQEYGLHGRSSGSGCCIIRLQGKDAASVRGLIDFADTFFEGVDNSSTEDNTTTTTTTTATTTTKSERAARKLKDLGVFRIENNVHAGFDQDVNNEGKMQVLYTKLIPPPSSSNLQNTDSDGNDDHEDPLLLPLEVGEMVGSASLRRAHSGMSTLFDIGSQITSAVLGMSSESTNKLLDDCSRVNDSSSSKQQEQQHEMCSENHQEIANTMSNSYQRIIRYLKPKQQQQQSSSISGGATEEKEEDDDAAFWPHVDSTFLTLIPLPDVAGLEVWCPSSLYSESDNLSERGEWVRPIKPFTADTNDVHVVALAGEFMQLLSNGDVPTCIHRVIAPKPPPFGFAGSSNAKKYKPRVSAPLFLRPRKGEEAILDVESDLRDSDNPGLYFEEGLLEECDSMRVWDYMDCMSPDN